MHMCQPESKHMSHAGCQPECFVNLSCQLWAGYSKAGQGKEVT